MRYTILCLCLLSCLCANAQDQTAANDTKPPIVFSYVEQMPAPTFEISNYLSSNLHYPSKAKDANITGRVIVKFIVTETGAIDSVKVIKGIGAGCDEEAVRVIKNMPPWKPGKQNGKPVRVYFTQPINFTLN